jgi:hypothetical protein
VPTGPDRRRRLALAAGLLYAALASLSRPLTGVAAVAVAVPAVIVLVRACRRRPPAPRDAGRGRVGVRRTALGGGAHVGLAGAVELVALARQPAYDVASPEHPTISLLLDPVTEGGPLRFVAWCCWLGLGWAVTRR